MPAQEALLAALLAVAEALKQMRAGRAVPSSSIPASNNSGEQVDHIKEEVDNAAMSTVKTPGMDAEEFLTRRKAAGITQREAARRVGVTPRTVIRWEHGDCAIDPFKAEVARRELVRATPALSAAERAIAKFRRTMETPEGDGVSPDVKKRTA